MDSEQSEMRGRPNKRFVAGSTALILLGLVTFGVLAAGGDARRAWQAYLINFLVFSALAQGAVLFSAVMHLTRARWSGPLTGLAEAFSAFFPVSLLLFVVLFLGREHLFPWLHQDLHGKEMWLNLPFLFTRGLIGLLILYGLGAAYLYHSLQLKFEPNDHPSRLRERLHRSWRAAGHDRRRCFQRLNVLSVLYIGAFALVLSLIGYDLVMSMDPHWYSTLFGAYWFIKAFYTGLGALIIAAAVLHLNPASSLTLSPGQFHDLGKLFFAFCLLWADFFYCQFVVIWYGNISEETSYIILRTMTPPWQSLAWTVFGTAFVMPFLILLNQKIKTRPKAMIAICAAVIVGIWLEHYLLLGPAWAPHGAHLTIGAVDGLIGLGFMGLLLLAVGFFLNQFPETIACKPQESR